ncbi:uncharacterized protein A4U43_C01F16100 [Asparagus officinalis]|uniref:WRKY domain-containing protein n=1 Tax=Asparagus officinalis TaxID=4686 RepID=A0A5P1FUA4_ASPOF|nr:WRKY transcription factor 22-like [Asparagus officinalis]ONK80301.1 uncharacterized protein A4U43_C01F16100 [Asparagus officinalis]
MDAVDDWDLSARGQRLLLQGKIPAAEPPSAKENPFSRGDERGNEIFANFPSDVFANSSFFGGLEDLYTPFLLKNTSLRVGPAVGAPKKPQRSPATAAQPPRSKRRKKNVKKVVCQVPADGVSSDIWAWRKYGQKPIKGSPYPRGYYRCSSYRGCPARKQVERNRAEPGQLIITYTSDHNHPVPTRHQNPSQPTAANSKEADQPPPSPATSPSMEEDEGELMVEDMEMIGEHELVFVGDGSEENKVQENGLSSTLLFDDDDDDDRVFGSPWLEKSNSGGNATAAAC